MASMAGAPSTHASSVPTPASTPSRPALAAISLADASPTANAATLVLVEEVPTSPIPAAEVRAS